MIALEVSSAAGVPPFGGIGGCIRSIVSELLEHDPTTRYLLCARWSRWRRGNLFDPHKPNASTRAIQDPFNRLLLRDARLLHSMGAYLPRTPKITKLVTVHDLNAVRNPHWCSPEWHRKRSARFSQVLGLADHVITPSQFMADEVADQYGFPNDRIHPILHGVDTERFKPADVATKRRLRGIHGEYVLSIGLLTPRKNFVSLVRAMVELQDLRLVLVGRPSDGSTALSAEIQRLRMQERVTHLCGLSEPELIDLMGAATAVAVPSLYEGFGLTALEALACAVPVICSKSASLPEVVGDAALLVDAKRPEEIAEAIRRATHDSELSRQLAARGRARAESMPWADSARTHRDLYHRLAPQAAP